MAEGAQPLVAIVGPTASGKSALALALAERFGGEIVSADSRQVYKLMDVGTAKPSVRERAKVPHHLIDVVYPDEPFNVAMYRAAALKALADIRRRGRLPLLVGGSGLYIRSVTQGMEIPPVPPDPALRKRLEAVSEREGSQALHQRLASLDPEAARSIDHRNVRRVVRALEVCLSTGQRFSELRRLRPTGRPLTIGLNLPREELWRRIDERVERMMVAGLVDEVKGLVQRGYGYDLPAMSGLGYRQIGAYLRGEATLEEAVRRMKTQTHRFARQQNTWFRPDDPAITWIDGSTRPVESAEALVSRYLATPEKLRFSGDPRYFLPPPGPP